LEEITNEEEAEDWLYSRDATADRTRLGDDTNLDAGVDWNAEGFTGSFDNVVIEAPSPPPVLVTIDRDTGSMTLESISGENFDINSLNFSSSSGSFNSDNWKSIAGNYDMAGDGSVDPNDDWTVTSQTATELSENTAGDGATITPGQTIDLGTNDVWLKSPFQDVRVELFDTGLGETVRGAISYTGDAILFADLNLDGDLNGLDWELFVAGYGSELDGLTAREAYLLADIITDFEHNAEDFIGFVEAYDEFNGEGAFAATIGVPEPSTATLAMLFGFSAVVLLGRGGTRIVGRAVPVCLALTVFLSIGQSARADLLAEYLFENGTTDTSPNGLDGILDPGFGGAPSVSGGVLNLTGAPLENMTVPLGALNPFDGSGDFTISMTFNTTGTGVEAGVLLFSSADNIEPANGDNHSMSIFIEPEGEIVYDNFFVGEVRIAPEFDVYDGSDHNLIVTYVAPEDLGDPEDPEPGTMFMNLDGDWLAVGEIAPNIPNISDNVVQAGSTLNDDFPFECFEGECFIQEFVGSMDNIRIYNENFAPGLLHAEVDRSSGDISFVGGEFARDIKFYEIRSEAGALVPSVWAENNLDAQGIDSEGGDIGQSWDALDGTADRLAEGFLIGSSLFDDDRSVSLGNAYNSALGSEDLEISAVTTDNDIIELSVEYFGEPTETSCDFNGDALCDTADIDQLQVEVFAGTNDPQFDLTGDGVVDTADRDLWLSIAATENGFAEAYLIGDANLDGSVGAADLNRVGLNWQMDSPNWSDGDFVIDGIVRAPDLNELAINWLGAIPVAAAAGKAVPEPASCHLILFVLLTLGKLRRLRQS
jgi:hypothetical protein